MIQFRRVLGRRQLSLWLCVSALGGCWSSDELVDGFTPAQWQYFKAELTLPAGPDPCEIAKLDVNRIEQPRCDDLAGFGQELFFEPSLSGNGSLSCATCHSPQHWFIDLRAPKYVSQGATGLTLHNTFSIVNVALKAHLAPVDAHEVFTWTGDYRTPGDVLDLAIPKAMGSSPAIVAAAIRSNPAYVETYKDLLLGNAMSSSDQAIYDKLKGVFEAYMHRLDSRNSPFDRYITEADPDALDESAKRGFELFVGRAMCIECHRGPLFTDFGFHVTGVEQLDSRDTGRGETGKFLTATLRHVAKTGPFMHNGSVETLADVIEFYRWGGRASGFVGDKAPLMEPLDITDDEARDLEAFLLSLTGEPIDKALTEPPAPKMACTTTSGDPGLACTTGTCTNVVTDRLNCGSCGNQCAHDQVCMGTCFTVCQMTTSSCPGGCYDLSSDPANCGSCGTVCPNNKPVCAGGLCRP